MEEGPEAGDGGRGRGKERKSRNDELCRPNGRRERPGRRSRAPFLPRDAPISDVRTISTDSLQLIVKS